jgi:hypothetical protein
MDYPKTIYIVCDKTEKDSCLLAYENLEDAVSEAEDHDGKVAVYRRVEIKKAVITRELK